MKQTRPFTVSIPDTFKAELAIYAEQQGKPYGVFFSTSGKALIEPVNPTAHYNYVFRTDRQAD